jgi:hypothetical protein
MTEQQFVYWLQGFAELCPDAPTAVQWQSIREHLAAVFKKVTPPIDAPKVDLSRNSDMKKLLEEASKRVGYASPALPTPAYSPYWLNDPNRRAGELIC